MTMKWLSFVAAVLIVSTGCSDKKTASGTGEGDKKLEVTRPENLTLKQGESKNVKLKITRKNFDEPVDVDISGLPEGVTIKESSAKEGARVKFDKGATEMTLTVHADDKAPVNKDGKKAMVSATGGGVSTQNVAEWTIKVEPKEGK
jgi:hypothetical protein